MCGCVGAEQLISPSGVVPRSWSGWFNLVDLWMIFDVCVCFVLIGVDYCWLAKALFLGGEPKL